MLSLSMWAGVDPKATYYDKNGAEVTSWQDINDQDAPLAVRFTSNASDLSSTSTIEWHFNHQGTDGSNSVTRYEADTEFTFTQAGKTYAVIVVREGNERIYADSICITISDSHLEMPNAFSPNGDLINDWYQAKSNYKSIVEFHAYIFNRWGQKLYEWTDHTDMKSGWDGTFHGSPVKDGVYFVLVKARGADGREYNIRRDVNLLRKKNTLTGETGGSYE